MRDALIATRGLPPLAANLLGCHRSTIHDYIHRYPVLEKMDLDKREADLDPAEALLNYHIAKLKPERGYVQAAR